uniref:Uncharacterized protein LOC114342964 n=1 Tax=Diabrotica virgifera virgifera TaxID=50390 RepID=A0A6P7GVZ9_DIAVI
MNENEIEQTKNVRFSPTDIRRLNKSKRSTRQINIETWKDVSRKNRRDSGLAYTTRKTKILVPAKKAPTDVNVCRKSCKQMCSHFTLPMRKDLFKFFYSHSYDEQSAFLTKCIRMEEPKRRRAGKTDGTSLKLCSFAYFINNKKEESMQNYVTRRFQNHP